MNKWLKYILYTFCVFLSVMVIIQIGKVDINSVDVTDLTLPNREPISDEKNAYFYLKQIEIKIQDNDLIENILSYNNSSTESYRILNQKYEQGLNLFYQALTCSDLQTPYVSMFDDISYLQEILQITYVFKAHILGSETSSKYKIANLFKLHRLGGMLISQGSNIFEKVIGCNLQDESLQLISRLIESNDNTSVLQDIIEKKYSEVPIRETIIQALKVSFKDLSKFIENAKSNNQLNEFCDEDWWIHPYLVDYTFHPNRTKLILSEYLREAVAQIESGELLENVSYDMSTKLASYAKDRRNHTFKNCVGKTMFVSIASGGVCIDKIVLAESQFQLIRLKAAMKLFKLKVGNYPKTLQALVPEYISTIPTDKANGRPLKLNIEKGYIYRDNTREFHEKLAYYLDESYER